MTNLPLITNSECGTYRRCPREHKFAYTLGVRSVETDAPLRFGTAIHHCLELVMKRRPVNLPDGKAFYDADPYMAERMTAMIDGYTARWDRNEYEVLATEVQFDCPLVNPATGAASTKYALGGKIDAIVRDARGDVWIMEHKTSSVDITPGSQYWQRLRLDAQISTYLVGARALGFSPRGVLYDVLGKPGMRPLLATPVESRKYTKTSELYASQRYEDETPSEYGARIRAAIAADPNKYYVRGTVVRLADEEREAAEDVWYTAARIRESRRTGIAPRNPDACVRYGRICAYMPVCTGESDIDNPARYKRVDTVHQELAVEESAQ